MSEIVIINDEPEAPAVDPAHEAQMEALADAVEQAQETADAALVATVVDTHVCRCDEVEAALGARLAALEAIEVVEAVAEVEAEDTAIEAAILEAETADVAPAPPVKEKAPAEDKAPSEEKPKRSGVSRGWFGSRAK